MIIRLVCTSGCMCRYDPKLKNNNVRVPPFIEVIESSPMLGWTDAFFNESFSVRAQSPTSLRNIDAILKEKVSMDNGKDCFLVGPATIAYFRTLAMLSIFPNAIVADNWGQGRVTAYFNRNLQELTEYDQIYDEMEVCIEIPP